MGSSRGVCACVCVLWLSHGGSGRLGCDGLNLDEVEEQDVGTLSPVLPSVLLGGDARGDRGADCGMRMHVCVFKGLH